MCLLSTMSCLIKRKAVYGWCSVFSSKLKTCVCSVQCIVNLWTLQKTNVKTTESH